MYCNIVPIDEFRNGEPRNEDLVAQADMVMHDFRHFSNTSDEDLHRLGDLFLHSGLVHYTLYHVVGSPIALTARCFYHRRIRADWCKPLLIDNANDKPGLEVVIEIARRLHLDDGDIDVSNLLRAMSQDVRKKIIHPLRCEGIELAGPDVFIK
jgi:hypothetical protein